MSRQSEDVGSWLQQEEEMCSSVSQRALNAALFSVGDAESQRASPDLKSFDQRESESSFKGKNKN